MPHSVSNSIEYPLQPRLRKAARWRRACQNICLDGAADAYAFSKLPEIFGFAIEYTDPNMNLRPYYPDFVAIDEHETRWILETKGQETPEVERKDEAAKRWCEDANELTGVRWRYLKVPQKQFVELQPVTLADRAVLRATDRLRMSSDHTRADTPTIVT